MKWIVAGSRSFTEAEVLLSVLSAFAKEHGEPDEVVSGGAKGADMYGESWARRRNIPVRQFLPDWETHGKAAGPIRNNVMAKYVQEEGILFLFWDGKSPGSLSMKLAAEKYGVPVYQFVYPEK